MSRFARSDVDYAEGLTGFSDLLWLPPFHFITERVNHIKALRSVTRIGLKESHHVIQNHVLNAPYGVLIRSLQLPPAAYIALFRRVRVSIPWVTWPMVTLDFPICLATSEAHDMLELQKRGLAVITPLWERTWEPIEADNSLKQW